MSPNRPSTLRARRAAVAAAALALGVVASHAPARADLLPAGDAARAQRVRNAILELDFAGARALVEGVDAGDGLVALERARLLVYQGECDAAATILSRPDLAATAAGADLGAIAMGCARATAATTVVEDAARGVVVRLQNDEDAALVPLLADVASRVRETLAKDLGVRLPSPIRIELIRDQFTLAAMTGLPEEAARTTGTVAVAKWGRVFLISPRAMEQGYPWLDTLAHELTHLALSQGTRDRAPLWLQEGVAKREEIRWRTAQPFDDAPPADSVAAIGMDRGLGRPIDKLGPSIAMLPTADQARVAFAEVQSFVAYWAREAGDGALPRLVERLKTMDGAAEAERAIADVSGVELVTWDKRWRDHLASTPHELPPEQAPGGTVPRLHDLAKRVRLGQLLEARGHHGEAAAQHARAQLLVPREPSLRAYVAESLVAGGRQADALPLVAKTADVSSSFGAWWTLRGLLHPDTAAESFPIGVSLDPLRPLVACEAKAPADKPADALRAALCDTARRVPVAR